MCLARATIVHAHDALRFFSRSYDMTHFNSANIVSPPYILLRNEKAAIAKAKSGLSTVQNHRHTVLGTSVDRRGTHRRVSRRGVSDECPRKSSGACSLSVSFFQPLSISRFHSLWTDEYPGTCDEICLSVEFVTVGFLRICRHSCCD